MVRFYRSPSPSKRRFIQNDSDISATRSPICGAAVLGKIIPSKSSNQNFNSEANAQQSGTSAGSRSQPEYVSIHSKRSIFQQGSGGLSYEPIGNSSPTAYSSGRKSPESTESSTSGALSHDEGEGDEYGDKHSENQSSAYVLQFEPPVEDASKEENNNSNSADELNRRRLRMDRLQAWMEQQEQGGSQAQSQQASNSGLQQPPPPGFTVRNRAHLWSTNLPVVTEERSFEAEDSSITSGPNIKEEGDQTRDVKSFSSPERNEMLLAMRQLVLKQQAALSEMAEENKQYRRDLQECRKLLQHAKEAYTKQNQKIENLMVEKESADAEVAWLREEVKTLRGGIEKHQEATRTWTSSKSSEEVEKRLRQARAATPERRTSREQTLDKTPPPPSPVRSPAQSPDISPGWGDWKMKSILPEMNYLSDEADDDDDLMKEVHELRNTLQSARISTKEVDNELFVQPMTETPPESRDDGNLSPRMWQQGDEVVRAPTDEMREWSRSRSRSPAPSQRTPEATRGRSPHHFSSHSTSRERSRTPSEVSAASSTVSATSSVASQRSREEVALFKTRLDLIQKKREQRKHIEENVGSRSGRVRFT